MDRLTVLKYELEIIKNLHCLSFNLIDKCVEYYEHEIECIEKYGSSNPSYEMPDYMKAMKDAIDMFPTSVKVGEE